MQQQFISPGLFAYNSAISSCDAMVTLREGTSKKSSVLGARQNLFEQDNMLNKGVHLQEALRLFRVMPLRRLHPDAISYNSATSVCVKASRWQTALGLMKEVLLIGLKIDLISYCTAMSACEKGFQ